MLIPNELKEHKSWLCYDINTKAPRAPWVHEGDIDGTNQKNHTDFDTALRYSKEMGMGVGFAFNETNGITGIDFDKCVTGNKIDSKIGDWIDMFNSYTEFSPSKKGIHILVKGQLPSTIKKDEKGIEAYSKGRYFTVTGDFFKKLPFKIEERQEVLNEFHKKYNNGKSWFKNEPEKIIKIKRTPLQKLTYQDIIPGITEGKNIPHPIHGSTEKNMNFRIDNDLGRCYRCEVSLTPIQMLAVKSGILSCEDAGNGFGGKGQLSKLNYDKSIQKKVEKYAIKENLIEPQKKKDKKKNDEEFKASDYATLLSIEDYYACMRDTKELYIYKDGIYVPGDSYVHEKALFALGDETTKHRVNEILFYIQATHYNERDDFDENPYVLNLENGLYDVFTKELKPHNPFYLSLSQLPIELKEEAECPIFLKFLEEVLPEEEDRNSIQEWFGYCLFKDYRFQEILVLVGSGRNGKSTLLRTLTNLLGSQNVSSVTLKFLSEDKFSLASLFNRYANIVADLPNEKIMNTGNIKSATGGDPLEAQRKFGHPFSFFNHAKFIFSCNEVPEMKDDSDANYRRWNYIDFLSEFEGENDDKDLIDKLTTKEEREGILKWALVGLERLIENGKFSNNKTLEERREETIKRAKSVHYFTEQCLEPDGVTHIEKNDLYENYTMFCKHIGIMQKTKIAFGRDISEVIPSIRSARRGEKGNRYTAWAGVKYINGTTIKLEKSLWCHRLEGGGKSSMTPCKNRDENDEKCQGCHTFEYSNRTRGNTKNIKNGSKIDDS